jgi:hypothetical protein
MMLEVLRQDYVTLARAKGNNEFWVIGKHALRNALIPFLDFYACQRCLLKGEGRDGKKTGKDVQELIKRKPTRAASIWVGVPGSKIVQFEMGNLAQEFPTQVDLVVKEACQIRHSALEAARVSVNRRLMKEGDIIGYEQVHVLDVNNGSRFTTYAIEGEPGEICLNGPPLGW